MRFSLPSSSRPRSTHRAARRRAPSETLTPVNFPNVGFNAGVQATIVSGNSYYHRSKQVAADIPAGEYVISTVAYDGYDIPNDRSVTVPQLYEQYILQFIDDAGVVIGRHRHDRGSRRRHQRGQLER